jgi:hypothetical protein
MSKSELLQSLERDGFVLVPNLLTPEQITELREAAKETVELARSGAWPHVRTLPKQFPPVSKVIGWSVWCGYGDECYCWEREWC